jgi:hypothetical protein
VGVVIDASSIPDAESVERPRVLLADEHPAMLALMADALAGECLVIGKVTDGSELLAEAERLDSRCRCARHYHAADRRH